MNEQEHTPKPEILIDDDWKSQAQAEKEKMAQAELEASQKQAKSGTGPDGAGGLPPADF